VAPQASQRRDDYKTLSYCHAHARVKIEHVFGSKGALEISQGHPNENLDWTRPQQSALLDDCMLYIAQLYTDT